MLNGKILNKPWFSHSEIKNGGTLIFQMGPEPQIRNGVVPPGSSSTIYVKADPCTLSISVLSIQNHVTGKLKVSGYSGIAE